MGVIAHALFLAGTLAAQTSTGGIRGIVRDDTGGVLVGVTVEASSPARMGTALAVTDADGAYRFENLAVGQYTVTFTISGFATVRQEGIRVEVGRSIELDQMMKVSAVAETLTVSGQAPVVDTVHGGTSSNFNAELVSNVAVSRVSFFDIPALAPGVQVTNSNIGTSSGFNINGSDSNQNAFQYDGLDVSAPSFGGPFDWPNFDMMQEMQVKSVGASAEYAGFQGGVINLVLKSGSNQFKGSGSFYGIWDSLQGNNTPWEEFPRRTDHRLDYNYSFGGPIVKDKLWFQYIAEHIRWERSDGLGVPPDAMDKTRIWRPFIKVDARPTNKDSFSVHYNDCRDWWGYGAGTLVPPSTASVEIGIDPVITAQWSHIFNSTTLLDVKGGGVYINKDYVPQQGDLRTPGHRDVLTSVQSVNRPYANVKDRENRQNINATLSHTATDFIKGTHEFKFGVQLTPWNTSTIRGGYASGKSYYDLAGSPYYILTQEPYAQGGTIKMYGVFVQDDWTFNRATVNLGLRYDRADGSVPSLDQLDSTLTPTGKSFPGVPNVFTFNNVSPRLGVAIKLDESARTVLKGHWGRYYSKMIAPQFQGISPGNSTYDYFFFNDATGKYDIPYYSIDPKANYGVDPNLTNQWVDQYFVGLERQLQPNFGINVSFLAKKESNFIRVKDVGATYAEIPFEDTTTGRPETLSVFNRIAGESLYQVTNRNDLDQDYKSFTIEANKRLSSRWQLQASYTWQRNLIFARGTVNSQGFGFLSQRAYGYDPNDLINAYGRSAVDSTNAVRLSGTWQAPFGIHVGATYFGDSGRPYGRIIRVPASVLNQGSRLVLTEKRGTEEMPALHNVKMRIDKAFPFARQGMRLRLSLDVQNLFNLDTPNDIQNNSSVENYYTGVGHVGVLNVVSPRQAQVGIRFEF
jgi:hypothetical protein